MTRCSWLLAMCAVHAGIVVLAAEPSFERDVRPIFKAHCFVCHGEAGQREGNLDLRLKRLALAGGDSGAALVPGKAAESLLYQRIRDGEMPPGKKKLSSAEIAKVQQWIAAGATTLRAEPAEIGPQLLITEEDRSHWAYQPVKRSAPPTVLGRDRVATPIDNFLLAKLEANQLTYSAIADKATLLRRATLDLTGLPPTPAAIDLFLADDAPGAYERLLDRLLASPRYGERWGRHWLDIAGYADSDGYTEQDPQRSHAWRYRDYVINAFNADKPLDEFIIEQLAGDELVKPPYNNLSADEIQKLVATGFLRMAPDGTASSGVEKNVAANQVVADTIKIVASSLLGLTVQCAQCHDHRYDPISQIDYFRLRAVFEPAFDWKSWRAPPARLVSLYTDADRAAAKGVEAEAKAVEAKRTKRQDELIEQVFQRELDKLPEELRELARQARDTPAKDRNDEQKKLFKEHPSLNVSAGSLRLFDNKAAAELDKFGKEAADIRKRKPVENFIAALTEVPGKTPAMHLFLRGDHEQPQQEVSPGELSILCDSGESAIPPDDPALPTSGRRLAYARWLTSGQHPLTARVLVNRLWLHHFGRGLVGTPSDFGVLGEKPTHPELLDWLADNLVSGGWRLKRLHKQIMLSTAYQQVSTRAPAQDAIDPDNRLYGHKSILRVEAETLRDMLLAISGQLNEKMAGPPVPVMADEVGQFVLGIENLNAGRPGAVIPLNGEEHRRSIYVQVRRSRPLSVLAAFDAPLMEPNCEVRSSSTVAPQALLLMNNDFVIEQSRQFARRVQREAGNDPAAQAELAWRLALGTCLNDARRTELVAFLGEQAKHFEEMKLPQPAKGSPADDNDPELLALASLCQALCSSNAFLYVE